MNQWYGFTPQDTLYFRGAEPANMGESHTASMIFPPPAHTIAGALRTAALIQNDVSFRNYNQGDCASGIIDAIGKSGEECPFGVMGPFFLVDGATWVPCPFTWFAEKSAQGAAQSSLRKVIVSSPVRTTLIKTARSNNLFWARGGELENLGGNWVCLDELYTASDEKNIKTSADFFVSEKHTGIALDVKEKRRTAREGHLYSFVHARLRESVKLVFGVNQKLPLNSTGVLKMGAEQRFGKYEIIDDIHLPQGKSGLFMTVSILAGSDEANRHCIATGRIGYLGGWDLHSGFHKPMKGYFPAGSVFDKKINDQCIEL